MVELEGFFYLYMDTTIKIQSMMPISLVDKVHSLFPATSRYEKTERMKSFRLLSYLYSKQNGNSYIPMSSVYLSKVFNGTYSSFVNKLREANIIEGIKTENSNDSYIIAEAVQNKTGNFEAKGICKKMRICAKYNLSSFIYKDSKTNKSITTTNTLKGGFELSTDFLSPVVITYKPKDKTEEQIALEKEFRESVESLKFDFNKLYEILDNEIKNISAEDFILTDIEGIEEKVIRVSFMGLTTYPMTVKKALQVAERQYSTLFVDDNKYYITSKEYFEKVKKANIYNSYSSSIERLRAGDLVATRNETNNRLDTNFTNMPSVFVKQIMTDNNLVQLDLANSQFALLSHHLEKEKRLKTDDFKLFKELAYSGKLYDYIAEITGISRKLTKKGFFEILFNKAGINTKEKELLRSIFPSVVSYADKFKRKQGYKAFSVFLQRYESTIFIDGLKKILDEKGIFNLTKHDAVIVREEDLEKTTKIEEEYFQSIDFKGKMVQE